MDPKELQELQAAYQSMYEAKAESSEKEEEDRKEDDDLAGSPNAKKNGKKKAKRWWDDDGDGKGYEKGEVKEDMTKGYVVTAADKKGNTPAWQGYKSGAKKKDGSPLYTAADHLKTEGVVKKELAALKKAKNTLSDKDAAKADDMAGVASRKGLPEETLAEKQKDTYDQVAAVIDYDRSKKGTDYATYDSEHGKKKEAKKERDYAAFERKKMKRDAQRSGHPWEHAKGSTSEKEGKKSEKTKHVRDPQYNSYEPDGDIIREEELWDVVAHALTELHEVGGVQFKVVPLNEKEEKDWIQGAVKRPGAFTKKAKEAGMSVQQFAKHVEANKSKYSTRTERQASLAQTFAKMARKEGVDFDALSHFLVNEGADQVSVNHVLANWVSTKEDYWMEFEEGYQRNPEKGEAEERRAERDRKASGRMPPRGDKRREDFEKWYAANVR